MNKRLCICVAFALAVPRLACAQRDLQQVPDQAHTRVASTGARDRAEGLIKLDVLVTDAAGKPVSGLDRADFSLLEEGRAQKILSFESFDGHGAAAEPPVKIILLIDTIALPENHVRDERLAVESYLRQENGRLTHPVSVYLLADTGLWTVAHPSADGNILAREIEHNNFTLVRHNVGGQRSAAPSALKGPPAEVALKALAQIASDERQRPGRKLLLWVGPGWGIGSGAYADAIQGSPPLFPTVVWFSTLLREARLVVYSFAVGETSPQSQIYKDYLDGVSSPHKASFMNVYRKVLAVQSGGRVLDTSFDLVQQIQSCVRDAGYFYRISFDPSPADHLDEYRDIKVMVSRPGLIARTNTGYYDQPYYSPQQIPAPTRVSIDHLEELLKSAHGESDAELAKQLSELELTERLSERRLTSFATVSGKRVRQELQILADASAFLDLPANETSKEDPPDPSAQQRMLSLTSEYLSKTIRTLPDFFATQTTVRYQETPMYLEGGTNINHQPLHVTDKSTTTVHYRNGYEIVDAKAHKWNPNDPELITYGEFGPVLEHAIDAIDSQGLTWSHWEEGASGRMAVFLYTVPTDKSIYESWLCCLPDGDGTEAFNRYVGYHAEIGIDPESGAILRLVLRTDFSSTTPMTRSDIVVDYGPVEIGGKTYICPLRSVSMVRVRSVRILSEWDDAYRVYGPYTTMLNDIRFDRYHIFRSESHVLTGFTPVQQ